MHIILRFHPSGVLLCIDHVQAVLGLHIQMLQLLSRELLTVTRWDALGFTRWARLLLVVLDLHLGSGYDQGTWTSQCWLIHICMPHVVVLKISLTQAAEDHFVSIDDVLLGFLTLHWHVVVELSRSSVAGSMQVCFWALLVCQDLLISVVIVLDHLEHWLRGACLLVLRSNVILTFLLVVRDVSHLQFWRIQDIVLVHSIDINMELTWMDVPVSLAENVTTFWLTSGLFLLLGSRLLVWWSLFAIWLQINANLWLACSVIWSAYE